MRLLHARQLSVLHERLEKADVARGRAAADELEVRPPPIVGTTSGGRGCITELSLHTPARPYP